MSWVLNRGLAPGSSDVPHAANLRPRSLQVGMVQDKRDVAETYYADGFVVFQYQQMAAFAGGEILKEFLDVVGTLAREDRTSHYLAEDCATRVLVAPNHATKKIALCENPTTFSSSSTTKQPTFASIIFSAA